MKRQPLRDSVEHRLPPTFGGFDESFWLERLTPPAIREIQDPPRVLCHLDIEAMYRDDPFSLNPRSVPTHKCSHLVIGFKEQSMATVGKRPSCLDPFHLFSLHPTDCESRFFFRPEKVHRDSSQECLHQR